MAQLEFLRLILVIQPQAQAQIVGEMQAADRHDAGEQCAAVAVQNEVGRPCAEVKHEHAMPPVVRRGHHRAGREAGQDELGHADIEAADNMEMVGDAALLPMHGPIANLQPASVEVFGIRHQPAVETERPAQMVHHHAALGELLRLREPADIFNVQRAHHIVGRRDAHLRLVLKALQMRAALREKHLPHPRACAPLRLLQRRVDALGRGLEVHDRALAHAARWTLAEPDEAEAAPARDLSDDDGDLGGADLDGADEFGPREHGGN